MKKEFLALLMIGNAMVSMAKGPEGTLQSGLQAERFDSVVDGRRTGLYTLVNSKGMEACVTNYGARLVSLMFDGKDMVQGFDNIGDYCRYRQNFGATVGRYVGRIRGPHFTLDGKEYRLQENGRGSIAHGGTPGFAARVWDVVGHTDSTLTLQYVSPDGENGFPGELTVRLTYRLSEGLEIDYEATTDKPTVLNLTNHSFFNISGRLEKEIVDELLYVNSEQIAAYDSEKNVNGTMIAVAGTPFDFYTEERRIGSRIDEDNEQLNVTKGYDHSFALKTAGDDTQPAARLRDLESGITMTVYTTEPAVHIYTANGLKGNMPGKRGTIYPRCSSVCFETMHFSDSPNQPAFPSTVLRPGETFRSHTAYVFSK